MVSLFKSNAPQSNLLLFGYALLLKFPTFIHPVVVAPVPTDDMLYRVLYQLISTIGHSFPLVFSVLAFAINFILAAMLNNFVNNQRLFPKPTYLTGMAFLLITSIFPDWYAFSAPLLSMMFLLLILLGICSLYNNPSPKKTLFNVGLYMGLSALLYFPSVVFTLLLLSGLTITRPFRMAEWLMMALGALTPYYFLWAYLFTTGHSVSMMQPTFAVGQPMLFQSSIHNIAVVLVLFSLLIGFFFIQSNMRRLLVQSRKTWSILYLFLLLAIVVTFLNHQSGFLYWELTAIPLAVLIGSVFLYPDYSWFPVVLHWAFFSVAAIQGYLFLVG